MDLTLRQEDVTAWWRHPSTQTGVTIALATPFFLFFGAALVMSILPVHPEYGLALNFIFWPYFGLLQLVYIAPLSVWSIATRRRRLASGLAFGAAVLAALNLFGWTVGAL